jgi:hypothetical protein
VRRLVRIVLTAGLLVGGPANAARDDDADKCSIARLSAAGLTADAPVEVTTASIESLPDSGIRYCLVRLRVGANVNLAAGLPLDGRWNGDLQAEGVGGYGGRANPPIKSVARGFLGVQTDTGHPPGSRDPDERVADDWRDTTGAFAMLAPGVPNRTLQDDFGHRSTHLMAVVAKQLAHAFYGRPVDRSYYNGCSTEGRHGLRAAQQYPADYDGILAGDPPIHFGSLMAYQMWPQVVMRRLVGHPIAKAKLDLASARAVQACDKRDGLRDSLLSDPRQCHYSAARDRSLVRKTCAADDAACLAPAEAAAIDAIWRGPVAADGTLVWRGIERGAPLGLLAGATPFSFSILQPRYWVYLDPSWDWHTLTMENYPAFFAKSAATVDPVIGAANPDLGPFFARGGKIIAYHGFNDSALLPQGTIDYYQSVARTLGRSPAALQSDFRLLMLPGAGHCGGGDAPQIASDVMSDALVNWVEHGVAPAGLTASQSYPDGRTRSRPVCNFPALPHYRGKGDPDAAASFDCKDPHAQSL